MSEQGSQGISRRIVVAGATGFIGRHLVEELVRDGHSVVALVRNVEKAGRILPAGTDLVPWSHAEATGVWRGLLDGADAVVNLAGAPIGRRWSDSVKREARESRVLATRHLIDAMAAARRPPRALVNGSAVGYYGASTSSPVDETSPAGDDFMARLCREWESEALRAAALGVRVVLVRTGVVLHPREGALEQMILPFRFFVGGPIGSGRQPVPWIHFRDELGILRWAIEQQGVEGPVNAVAPGIVTNAELARELGRVLHRPSFLPAPELAVRLVLGEGAMIVTEGQWVQPRRTVELGYHFRWPRLREALDDLFS